MTADFFWAPRPRPTRGPKAALTLDQIADAAIAIADAEGLAAVSMQRVAADLGYTKMSLYRYLPGKAEMVAAMLERALAHPPRLGNPWREALTDWATALLAAYTGHPWALEASSGRRPIGPGEMAWMESALRVLPPGLSGAERLDTVATIAGHVRMIVGQVAESDLTAAMGMILRDHAATYPAVVAAISDVAAHGGADNAFAFGLGRILDGLECLLEQRASVG
ncbi:TetR/AcrR family transcriptional regulator C-terminal domain-containing protein [Paractinoplanes rhizophilus]|jgi:AcrR family transcriptional regulator|uniref:TetR/AcrR family transcriptional regulator C-terminal domain-containing protein n=1 Tax=Paractinoplanes rhizophilus TaxID=1416877 RepID=A0ABW2HYU1_9ACTN|nr:TetR/AcrR family transcriptional regulator C-terminal domain-containing protein [Actinoplanes sp.]